MAEQQDISARNLLFIMGTMKAHPQTFIVIGLLRSGFAPQEVDKLSELILQYIVDIESGKNEYALRNYARYYGK